MGARAQLRGGLCLIVSLSVGGERRGAFLRKVEPGGPASRESEQLQDSSKDEGL